LLASDNDGTSDTSLVAYVWWPYMWLIVDHVHCSTYGTCCIATVGVEDRSQDFVLSAWLIKQSIKFVWVKLKLGSKMHN